MMHAPSGLGSGVPLIALAAAVAACSASALPERAPSPGVDAGVPACNAPSTEATLFEDTTGGVVGGLFVFDSQVFFSWSGGLSSVPLGGGPATPIATGASGVAIVGGTLYTTSDHPVGAPSSNGKQSSAPALYATPFTGVSPDAGASGGPSILIQDNFVAGPTAADGASLYVASGASNSVLKITPPSTTPVTLAFDGTFSIRALAVDATYLYAAVGDISTSPGNGVIVRMPKVGRAGGPTDRLLTLPGFPDDLLVDGQTLYWIDEPAVGTFGNSRVVRAPISTAGTGSPWSTAATASTARARSRSAHRISYFTTGSSGPCAQGWQGHRDDRHRLERDPGLLQVSRADVVWVDNFSRALSSTSPTPIEALCAGASAPAEIVAVMHGKRSPDHWTERR